MSIALSTARLVRQTQWFSIGVCSLGVSCQQVTPHPEAERQATAAPTATSASNGPSPGGNVTARSDAAAAELSPDPEPSSQPRSSDTSQSEPPRGSAVDEGVKRATRDGGAAGAAPPGVKRLSVASSIVNREPVVAEQIRTAEPVYAFLELTNESDEADQVRVVFEHESGTQVGFVDLEVPANKARWRTWAQTERIASAGQWAAVVLSTNGTELGRAQFVVE